MLYLVVDTNLFHEFRALEELPWNELIEDEEIVLLVTEIVQSELDEQKKSTRARIKRRAIGLTAQFRAMLLSDQSSLVIREKAPRVVLRLDDTSCGQILDETLDPSVADDRLVAIAKKLSAQLCSDALMLFSDDTRPLRKAKAVGVPFLVIPDHWRRPDEQTDEDKDRRRLEQENLRLKSQEPILSLSVDPKEPIELTVARYPALSADQIDDLMNVLRQKNPLETRFDRRRHRNEVSTLLASISIGIYQEKFKEACEEDIRAYREEKYPEWESKCRNILHSIHVSLAKRKSYIDLEFFLKNTGTRPALNARVTFRAKGPLVLLPQDDMEELDGQNEVDPAMFPSAPEAPQGQWVKQDFSALLGASLFDGVHRSWGMREAYSPLKAGLPVQPIERRDPDSFYYTDRPSSPVAYYSLTCEQFRHAGDAEIFLCQCFSDEATEDLDGVSALIECFAEAANLSAPVRLHKRVKISVEQRSTYDDVMDEISPRIPPFCVSLNE